MKEKGKQEQYRREVIRLVNKMDIEYLIAVYTFITSYQSSKKE